MQSQCKWYPVCPMKFFLEQGRIEKKWAETYCKGNWKECRRHRAVEDGKPCPDSMMPDGSFDKRLED